MHMENAMPIPVYLKHVLVGEEIMKFMLVTYTTRVFD